MHGWKGQILHIDLTEKRFHIEKPDINIYHTYIGGKGLCGYYLKPYIQKGWDDPAMPLLFFTGPLVDTPSPTSGRMTIMSRSPLTGTIGDTSVGGKFANQVKRAGYDGIIITGKSKTLTGITIENDTILFHDAADEQAKAIPETGPSLNTKAATAVIGPAAENGVLFANIAFDSHFFSGRNGLGLVMADKALKYITISGNHKTTLHDKDTLMQAREEIFRLVSASPILKGDLGISNYGTGALYDLMHARRMMPTKNFRETHFKDASSLNAYAYKKAYDTKKTGCQGCHIQCKKKGQDGEILPEFETMSHFTALLENTDIDIVKQANILCNEYGLDTITTAVTIACYTEIEDKKLNGKQILDLITDIAYNKNSGVELKTGSKQYAVSKGKSSASISVKGLELPAYDPRGAYGMALAYATSTRGGCHLRSYPISHEILRKPVATDRFSFSGKARIIKLTEDINAMVDSLIACKFLFFAASLEEYAKALYGATGFKTSAQELMQIGERIFYNERIMNAANGFTDADDDLPERFFKEAGSSGDGIQVPPINRDDFLEALHNYYKIRGLDEHGIPTEKKAKELGLDIIIE